MREAETGDREQGAVAPTPAERMSMYYAALRRNWRLVLGIVGVAALAGVVAGGLAPKSYEATAKVLIGQRAQVDALLGAADYTPDPERDVNTSVELITLEPVAEQVRRRLRLDLPTAALIGKVGTAVDRNSNVVSITVADASPERAAAIANAFAAAYRSFRARAARAGIEDAIAAARRRAAALAPGPEREALDARLRELQAAAAFQTAGVQVVRRATASSAVASRRPLTSGIVAGFLGVILAAVAVVILARTDKRMRSEGDVEALVGRPLLATVPLSDHAAASGEARDSLATLALSLALRGLSTRESGAARRNGRSPCVLLLTSPGPEEGTAELTLGLAEALAGMGRRVIAIEADLRDPTFATRLGLEPEGGLVDVLAGRRAAEKELVPLGPVTGRDGSASAIPAGSPAALPQRLLAGNGMAALVAKARRRADVVLIAGAPAGHFGDSFALAPLVDATLLVARIDVTSREDALRVVRTFDGFERQLLGAVATRGRPSGRLALAGHSDATPQRARPEPLEPADGAAMNGSAREEEVTVP